MKSVKKAIAVSAVIALVLFVAFLPVFAALMEGGHDCRGEQCFVCSAINSIHSKELRSIGLSGAILFIALLVGSLAFLPGAFVRERISSTPVSLKNKLLN